MLLFSLSHVYFSPWHGCSVKSWLLCEQKKCHPGCVPVDEVLSVCWFLALAHPWSCCGSWPSCSGGVWVFQLVPWCLGVSTCKTEMIWHGGEPSSWWKASTEFWVSEGTELWDLWYQHLIFSLLWAQNPSRAGLQSFMFSDKCRSNTSLSSQKPFLI